MRGAGRATLTPDLVQDVRGLTVEVRSATVGGDADGGAGVHAGGRRAVAGSVHVEPGDQVSGVVRSSARMTFRNGRAVYY
jgi:hypothetical protein